MELKLYMWNMVWRNDPTPYTLYAVARDEKEAYKLVLARSKDGDFGKAAKAYIETNKPMVYDEPEAFIRHGHASFLP